MSTPDPTLRLYAIVRGDLMMTPGKTASQAGHAFLGAFQDCQNKAPPQAREYSSDGPGTKVCLVSTGLEDLMIAYELAIGYGLPCALVIDSGHIMPPFFDGQPIVTAVGIGPATREQIGHITKPFNLA